MLKRLSFLSVSLFLLFILNCESSKEFKPIIKIVDGVKIIINPLEPKIKNCKWLFKKNLTIGEQQDKNANYQFFRPFTIRVDQDENIYVLDVGDKHIQVYDKNGKYLRTISRPGQGPGEIGHAIYFDISSNGYLGVCDQGNHRVSIFSLSGEYITNFNVTEGNLREIFAVSDTSWIVVKKMFLNETSEFIDKAFLYSSKGTIITEYSDYKYQTNKRYTSSSDEQYYSQVFFSSTPSFAFCKTNGLYSGKGNEYEISLSDLNGSVFEKIRREYNPVIVTENERNEILKSVGGRLKQRNMKAEFCEHKPAYNSLAVDDDGNLWIRTSEKNEKGEVRWDVFNSKGHYIANVYTELYQIYFAKGFAYSIISSVDNVPILKRCEIVK